MGGAMKQQAPALSTRLGPLALIVLLHVGFFYALERGLAGKSVPLQTQPKEVFATLVTPAPQSTPRSIPKPEPEAPKSRPAPKPIPKPTPKPIAKKAIPAPDTAAAPSAPPTVSPAPPAPPAPAAAPAAPPASPAPPKTISGVEYLQPPNPEYPAMSRRMREEGTAVLRVLVNARGRAERVELQKSTGSSRLDEAAKQAVLRTLFKPYLEDGKALPVFATIPIKFQLD
jgi:periplasmic protein TonB